MTEFTHSRKNAPLYIDIAANANGVEKSAFLIEALRRSQQYNNESLHAIEIGPGGGSAIASLADTLESQDLLNGKSLHVSLLELDKIESQQLLQTRQRLGEHATHSFHQGNAESLDSIFKSGANIVNASAVMHEVYSYGNGYHSIDNTLGAITNTLHPGGYFAYRDVFAVDRMSQHERVRHIYDHEAWVTFSRMFLDYYLENANHPYHRQEDRIIFSQDSKRIDLQQIDTSKMLSIDAPIGLLRELQRHYITMRDHLWRAGILGLIPDLEGDSANDWLDIKRGHKRVHYRKIAEHDVLLDALSENSTDETRIVDGDVFDQATDAMIIDFLNKVTNEDDNSKRVWQEWIEREGAETYTYMTLNKFLGSVAMQSFIASDSKKILLPVQRDDVKITPRRYYNRFLEHTLSNPLIDAKQLVLFKAVDMTDKSANNRQDALSALSVLDEHCQRETLAEIYMPIKKLFNNTR